MSSRIPIVVVLGATGAGKSKLALEIAHKFGGEIINADAMQMYKGLDVVTNKVTPHERKMVKHHLIDFLDPLLHSTVIDFRNQALPLVDSLREKKIMPVICGGTNYYIESLMWNVLVEKESCIEPVMKRAKNECEDYESLDNMQLYQKLIEVDPERAKELHPNTRRKILRSLEVFRKEGKLHSQILAEQRQMRGGGILGGGLRYPVDQLVVIWVQCDQNILDKRCDKRVDQMIAQGLVSELQGFHQDYNRQRGNAMADYTMGIFQSIGFKEFHEYLLMDDSEQKSPEGQSRFENGKNRMMLATRKYARKQVKWMRQRFLRDNSDRQCPPVFGVDSKDPSQWDELVRQPAFEVVEAYISGKLPPKLEPLPCTKLAHSHEDTRQMFHCEVCNMRLQGKLQLEAHNKSRRHKKLSAVAARRQAMASIPSSAD